MYNQWAFQQITAIQQQQLQQQLQQQYMQQQLQQQLQQQYMVPQMLSAINSPAAFNSVSVDDDNDEDDDTKRTLFCANLDERVTEELLYEVFLQAGPIESARIPKDNSGRQRTFGFVTYVHSCSAPYAMHLYQGLTLFRKPLTIKYQQSNSAPPTPQHHLRSQTIDCESRRRHSGGVQSRGSYDNSSLRGSNFAAFNHEQNPSQGPFSPSLTESPPANPFRRELGPLEITHKWDDRSDWTRGSSAKERVSSSAHSRSRQNAAPYKRRTSGEGETHDRNRDQHGNEYQRRHQHAGSNRQSEQRQSNNNNRSKSRR